MTLSEVCVRRPVFAVMLISFLVVLGIFSYRDLGVDLFPKADPPVVGIQVSLPGATPEEVTTQVVLPLEDVLSSVSGIEELNAQISEGGARIICRFSLERGDVEGAAQDVREKVATATRRLPSNMDPPIVTKADPDADPVIALIVAGAGNLRETTEIADKQIKRALETVPGVGEVVLAGGRKRQIRVFVDAEKLNAYGITITEVERAIQNENVEIPGGKIIRGESELGVRTLGRIDAVEQFGNIIVTNVREKPVRINDLGRVEDSYPEPTSWNWLQEKQGEGKEAVALAVRRQSGTNTVEVVDAVKQKLERMRRTLPPGISLRILQDKTVFIKASVQALQEHLLLGALLASLVVLLFLRNWRSVAIAAVAIPTSIIATFTLLRAMDFTLNNMTLLALTLSVGIVIDDGIVVLENIYRYLEEKGYEPKRAAIEATKEITLPVMATTLSLVIIFVPIAFMTGFASRYLHSFGWTMACSIMVSMLVAFTLTPMLSSLLLRRLGHEAGAAGAEPASTHRPTSKESGFYSWMERVYTRLLTWSLDHRWAIVLVALGTFALMFPLNRMVGRDFIPADDQGEFEAIIDTPPGTSLQGTAKIASEMARQFVQFPEVEFVRPNIGDRSTHSHMYIRLVDASQRRLSHIEVAQKLREIMSQDKYRDVRSKVSFPSALGSGEQFGSMRSMILGPDMEEAAAISARAVDRMRNLPELVDVNPEFDLSKPELQIEIDRQRASDLGVHASDVARAVRLMMAGTDQISVYKEGDEQYDVTLQLLPEQQKNPEVISRLMIPSSKVGQVRLDNIATVERALGPQRVDRYNRQFQAVINANNRPGVPLDAALRLMSTEIQKAGLPPGYTFQFVGVAKELDRTTHDLIMALLMASLFMYMVLAAQFESFVHPFTIMLSLPLSIPFALLSLWLTGRTLNLWSALGVLLLLGIVKKNGILQVDYTNRLRAQGTPLREAILQANRVRLRPILMTTASIIAGLTPTALGVGAGSTQRSAIAVTIIGGQALCLLLTLLLTPVAYSLFAELEQRQPFQQVRIGLAKLRLGLARVFSL